MVIGVALTAVVFSLVVLVAGVSGILGVGAEVYHKDSVAIVTGTLRLALIGLLLSLASSAMKL